MNYVSTRVVESKSMPGVKIVVRRMNERGRMALDERQAGAVEKLKPLFQERAPLNEEYFEASKAARAVGAEERKAAIAAGATEAEALERHPYGVVDFANEKFARWAELGKQIRAIEARLMEPVAARAVVARIEGLEIDGQAAGVDELLADGPDELVAEVMTAVKRELGLEPAEVENLLSPSTSAGAVDGAKSTGNAGDAATTATTTGGAAASSTGPGSATAPGTA